MSEPMSQDENKYPKDLPFKKVCPICKATFYCTEKTFPNCSEYMRCTCPKCLVEIRGFPKRLFQMCWEIEPHSELWNLYLFIYKLSG